MTTGVVATPPILQFTLNNGQLAVNGSILTQVGGVNAATYSDSGLTTPLPNPIPLNSRGEVSDANGNSRQLFLTPNTVYTFTLYDGPNGTGNVIWTAAYVNGVQVSITQASIGAALYPQTAAETAAGVTPSNFGYPPLNPWRYGADGTGGSNDTTAYNRVNSVIAQIAAINGWLNGMDIPGYPKTALEIGALVVPKDYSRVSDGVGEMSVFRFFTEAQINDVLAGTAAQDVSAAIQAANDYIEGKAVGAIGTLGTLVAGTGYNGGNPGTFNNVALSGGTGQFASGTVVVGASGTITSITIGYSSAGTWVGNPGNGYAVGNTLTLTSANMVAAGAAAGGGSTCTIQVATLATGGKTGSVITPGGTLFFPSGRYYCGTSGVRIGDMVRWLGSSVSGTRFTWSNTYNGNRITIGPDASGYNGRGGFYAMGANLERCTVECGNGTGWGVYTIGLQQNGRLKDVWVEIGTATTGGVYLQDHLGSANMLCEDTYVFPATASISASAVGFHCDGGSNLVLSRCSCNGASGSPLFAGIAYSGGQLTVRDFQCEVSVTHLDVSAGAGENAVIIQGATMNLSSGGVQGIWIHSGFAGTIIAQGLSVGPGQVPIRNDNTGEQGASSGSAGIVSSYVWSGTTSDISVIQNTISVPPILTQTAASSGQTVTPNCGPYQNFVYSVSETGGLVVAAPVMGSNAMPSTQHIGRRLKITIRALAVLGATTWNAVYKMSAWTNPANGNSRSIEFEWNGTNWVQLWQATVDVPN